MEEIKFQSFPFHHYLNISEIGVVFVRSVISLTLCYVRLLTFNWWWEVAGHSETLTVQLSVNKWDLKAMFGYALQGGKTLSIPIQFHLDSLDYLDILHIRLNRSVSTPTPT